MRFVRSLMLVGLLAPVLALGASPAAAQDGFALKFGTVFNSSTVEDRESDLRLSDAAGWHLGAEYVFANLGVGLSGYTAGGPSDFSMSEGSLVFLGEANYFFKLPLFPVSPTRGSTWVSAPIAWMMFAMPSGQRSTSETAGTSSGCESSLLAPSASTRSIGG
jgi:hypothetical protein